ncbi:MAG: DUF1648 domain-containing protein [Arcicella sp.]|jgi:uncharacterized membrane protein|nr:DUF1648 domain-containing protein [Arcicella sp.]
MSIEFFISRVWRYASILAFVIVLLFTYRGLPDPTAVHFGPDGRGDGFLPKNQVFYLFGSIMFGLNILIVLLINTVKKLPKSAFNWIPNKIWLEDYKQLQTAIINWLNFLPAIINTFLLLILRALLALNDERSFNTDYTYLLVIGAVLFLAWLFYLPIKLLYTKPKIEEE